MATLELRGVTPPLNDEVEEIELKDNNTVADNNSDTSATLNTERIPITTTTTTTSKTISNKKPLRNTNTTTTTNYNNITNRITSSLDFMRSKWEDLTGIGHDIDTALKYDLEMRAGKVKMYWKSTLFVTGIMYFFNFIFLYFGTVFESEVAQPHKFFGFKEGKHCHLQRTNGIFWLLLSCVNFFALAKDEERGKTSVLLFSAVCNAIMAVHYGLEMFYFVGMRMEIIAIQLFILGINQYWTWTDYRHRRQVYALRGQDPNLALRDEGVRKKLNKLKEKKQTSQAPTILVEERPVNQTPSTAQRRKKSALA